MDLANKIAAEIATALANFFVNFQNIDWSACAEIAFMLTWIYSTFFNIIEQLPAD